MTQRVPQLQCHSEQSLAHGEQRSSAAKLCLVGTLQCCHQSEHVGNDAPTP